MLSEILNTANLYATGLQQVKDRKAHWVTKYDELRDHLKKVADHLNEHTNYRQGFFVDSLHAFNEQMNGTCSELSSLTFRSGDMPMLVTFQNSLGMHKDYMEEGFRISFNPMITGEILVLLLPHQSDLNRTEPQYTTLAIISEPGQLTMDMVDDIINRGIEAAYYSSFTGVAERPDSNETDASISRRSPIGFKRYETTENIQQ